MLWMEVNFSLQAISCLAKLENGNAYADEGYNGEAKTGRLKRGDYPQTL